MKPREPGVYAYNKQTAVVRRDPLEGLVYYTASGTGRVCSTVNDDWEEDYGAGGYGGLLRIRDIQKLHIEEGDSVIVKVDKDIDIPEGVLRKEFMRMADALGIIEKGAEIHLVTNGINFHLVRKDEKDTDQDILNLKKDREDAIKEGRLDTKDADRPHVDNGLEDGVSLIDPTDTDGLNELEGEHLPEFLQSLANHEPEFMNGKMVFAVVARHQVFADGYVNTINTIIDFTKETLGIEFKNELVVVGVTEYDDLFGLNVVGAVVTKNVPDKEEVITRLRRRVRSRMHRYQ
jgi:hypothetical protein